MLHNANPKTRRTMAMGSACLAAGLMLWEFVHPASPMLKDMLHAVAGFLFGLSIAINLVSFRRRKREDCTGA